MVGARSLQRRSVGLELALVAVILAAPNCAQQRTARDAEPRSEWSLRVENHHWLDVTVLVEHGGQRTRAGIVTAATTGVFVLPPHLLGPNGEIRLVASPVGGGATLAVTTEVIVVGGGQIVPWTLERSLSRSSVAVW